MGIERISDVVACNAGRPLAQFGFLVFCAIWLIGGFGVDTLTLALSILAITLTQMVLASQDKITSAEHKKLDAIIAGTDADDKVAGIENEQ